MRREIGEVARPARRAAIAPGEELEKFLLSAATATWFEAVEKARYLLSLFAASAEAQDPRRQKMTADLLSDFERLLDRPD